MFKMLNAKYRGVSFDFEGERKSDLVECLAGIDYYLAREAAPHDDVAAKGDSDGGQDDGKRSAGSDDKAEAKTTRRRSAASSKKAAAKTEEKESDSETLDEKAAADTKKQEAEAKADVKENPAFTADDVKGRLQQYIEAFGSVQAKEMLGRYGVAKRSELSDEQTVDFMAEMEDRLEAGE